MPDLTKLTHTEIQAALAELHGWTLTEGKLHREYRFADFIHAFGFMATSAVAIEAYGHHPEWFNVYNKVIVDLGPILFAAAGNAANGNFSNQGDRIYLVQERVVPGTPVAPTNAASFLGPMFAAEEIVAVFGQGFSNDTEIANDTPLPTTLAGVTVEVTDSAGETRQAPQFFASPGQVNAMIPEGTAEGMATLSVIPDGGDPQSTTIMIGATGPGVFAVNQIGSGPAAAGATRVDAMGTQTPVTVIDGTGTPVPIDLDTFDPKPLLNELDGQLTPPSFGKLDFQFSKNDKQPLLGTRRTFKKRGQSGIDISDLFEHTAEHADDMAVIRSCYHDGFTHITGQNWLNTGWAQVGRPSLGSWVVYGLGSESENLPAYMVMLDGGIKSGSPAYGSGFLPAMYQGTVLRSYGPPILNVNRPKQFTADEQRTMLDKLNWFNQQHLESRQDDSQLAARMSSYELAFKMQTSVPDLADISGETEATKKLYGLDNETTREFGKECLLARRMVERGVRFIQIYSGCGRQGGSPGWDGHNQLDHNHTTMAAQVDKPISGLLTDLKSRGMLEETLIVWGGDFGRTPFTDGGEGGALNSAGRDHNPYGFSVWMAGGGVRGGKIIGATDEIGLQAAEDRVHVHDLHATILTLMGLDHEALTYHFQGRDFRLTDVGGENNLAPRLTEA